MKLSILVGSVALVLVSGCGSTPAPDAPKTPEASGAPHPSCTAIHTACDPYEGMGGVPKECHDLGQAATSTNEMCEARKTECMTACPPSTTVPPVGVLQTKPSMIASGSRPSR